MSCSLPSVHRRVPRRRDRARCRLRSTGLVAPMTLEPRDFRGSFDHLDQERRAEGCCDPGEEQPCQMTWPRVTSTYFRETHGAGPRPGPATSRRPGPTTALTERRLARLPQAARPATARPTARAHGPDSGAVVTWSDSNCDTCVPADTLPSMRGLWVSSSASASGTEWPVRVACPVSLCVALFRLATHGYGLRPDLGSFPGLWIALGLSFTRRGGGAGSRRPAAPRRPSRRARRDLPTG